MDRIQALRSYLAERGLADWVQDIREHFTRTGEFRPGDLQKLFGDPNKRVEMPRESDKLVNLIAVNREE